VTEFRKVPRAAKGIALHNDALYAEQNDKIIRYILPTDSIVETPAFAPRSH
jgi:hypothetical protein